MTHEQARQCVEHFAHLEEGGQVGRSGPFGFRTADIVEEAVQTTDEMLAWKCYELVLNVLAQNRFPESFWRFLKRTVTHGEAPETFKARVFGFYAPRSTKDAACLFQIMLDDFWPLIEAKDFPVLHAPFAKVE